MKNILKVWKGRLRNPHHKCLATLGLAVGSAALSTLFDNPQVGAIVGTSAFATVAALGGQVAGVFKDVVNDISAGSVDELMSLPPSDQRFKNHHLTRLIGDALNAIILEEIEQPGISIRERDFFKILAEQVKESWAEFKDESNEPLSEDEITELFSKHSSNPGALETLTPAFWSRSLTDLVQSQHRELILTEDATWTTKHRLQSTIDRVGEAISRKLYPTLVNLLVNNASIGGEAFAAIVFKLLTELCGLQHLVANDVHASRRHLVLLRDVMKTVSERLSKLCQRGEKQANEILTYARNIHENILTITLESSRHEAYVKSQFDETASALQRLLRLTLPVDQVPTIQRWIELRHDKLTLLKRRTNNTTIASILKLHEEGARHFLLVGPIASGKSTIVADLCRQLTAIAGSPKASMVLPLGIDFSSSVDGWTRERAVDALVQYLRSLSHIEQREHLIVVEDAHASSTLIQSFTGNVPMVLSECCIIATCRPGADDFAVKRLKEYWGIEPVIVYVSPEISADSMVDVALSDLGLVKSEVSKKLLSVFREAGCNLFVLQLVIAKWSDNPSKAITMELAYQAVTDELRRIASQVSGGEDSGIVRAKLAVVWMLSGLDVPARQDFLSSCFGLDLPHSQIRELEKQLEITTLSINEYSVRRHPAWGLLVLKAIDVYRGLKVERSTIVEGFRKFTISNRPPKCQSEQLGNWKASECVIFALLDSGQIGVQELALACSGKHISDEFVRAVRFRVECQRAVGREEVELGEEIMGIADNLRRVSSEDPNQQIQNWKDGEQLLNDAVTLREAKFGVGLPGDERAGYAYYQIGYYQYLLGRFGDARATFAKSADCDLSIGGQRHIFAGMSKVMEAYAAMAAGDVDRAEDLVKTAQLLITSDNSKVALRFAANAEAMNYEIHLRRGRISDARGALERCLAILDGLGMQMAPGIYEARLSLKLGDFSSAEELIKRTFENPQHTSNAETRIQATRIRADCSLALGMFEKAEVLYRSILPTDLLGPLCFEQQLCQDRLNRMVATDGTPIDGRQIIMSSVV